MPLLDFDLDALTRAVDRRIAGRPEHTGPARLYAVECFGDDPAAFRLRVLATGDPRRIGPSTSSGTL